MIADFARVLRAQLKEEIENAKSDLGMGRCASFDEYQNLCGLIRGLERAEQMTAALAKKAETDDDDDDDE